jgi:hypothetical protein
MATQTATNDPNAALTPSRSFERFASVCAILAGIVVLLYAVSFVILRSTLLSGLFLMLGGLLTTAVLLAVYNRVRTTDATFALWAMLLSITGALGSAVHGGYDLANALNTPSNTITQTFATLPNPIDPRGLLTFGLSGLGLFVLAWLIGRSRQFPHWLPYWGYLLAILFIILYLGRLILFSPSNPLIFAPVLLSGFLVNPVWYFWLGFALLRSRSKV